MKTPPDLALVYAPVASLVPYAKNARTHSARQVGEIAESIKAFGFTNPILVDGEGGIIAGHGRLLAAQSLGMEQVPTIALLGLTEAQRRAYVLADNKLALNAGWDVGLLVEELKAIQAAGEVDLSLLGWSDEELADLLPSGTPGLTDPEETPEPPADPVSRLGDVWILGKHRLICGDSTDALVVGAVLGPVKPHLMVTDPPYGVKYDPSWRAKAGVNKNQDKLGVVLNDDRADWTDAWKLFPGDVAYVWHGAMHSDVVLRSLEDAGFERRSQIIWVKERFALGRGHYHWQHEPAWYVVRKGQQGHWHGDRSQTTTWHINAREDSGHGHGTQKPVDCMRRPIENNSSPGQAVYEPFSGSGTTIIAAEQLGRCCHAVELSPAYVDVGVLRWEAFTGDQAVLESTGQTFAQVKVARADDAGAQAEAELQAELDAEQRAGAA